MKLLPETEYMDKVGVFTEVWAKLPINLSIKRVFLDDWFNYSNYSN